MKSLVSADLFQLVRYIHKIICMQLIKEVRLTIIFIYNLRVFQFSKDKERFDLIYHWNIYLKYVYVISLIIGSYIWVLNLYIPVTEKFSKEVVDSLQARGHKLVKSTAPINYVQGVKKVKDNVEAYSDKRDGGRAAQFWWSYSTNWGWNST